MKHVFEFETNDGRVGVPYASVIEISKAYQGSCCHPPDYHAMVRTCTPMWRTGDLHASGEWHATESVRSLIDRLNSCAGSYQPSDDIVADAMCQ